ncbi:hypothetical protein GCM10027570_13110 [Streptomonospora sediminis]
MDEMPGTATAFIFHTECRRPGSRTWQEGRPFTVRFEPGGAVPLARLGWRDRDGAEADIGFEPGMDGFLGLRTAADGTALAWRGRLAERSADRTAHRFGVVSGARSGDGSGADGDGADGGAADAGGDGELRVLIGDGGAPAVRVTWAEPDGGGGAIALRHTTEVGGDLTRSVREITPSDELLSAGEVAENVLDPTGKKWLGRRARRGDWLMFHMAEPVTVRHYMLKSANDFADRDPRDWVLKGSADGETWTVLDTRIGEFFPSRYQERGYDVATPGAEPYRYFLLEFTENHGASETQLSQVRLHSEVPAYESFTGYRHGPGEAPRAYEGLAAAETAEATAAPGARVDGPPAADLTTAESWRSYLAEYSTDMLRVAADNELREVTDEQRAAGWLGFEGATEEQLTAAEERLGAELPPSYRSFLAASNGWRDISAFMNELLSAENIEWLDGSDAAEYLFLLDDVAPHDLEERVLLVSGEGDAQYWLLDSGDVSPDGEWAAYIWASWYPALGDRHRSFADLVAAERESFEMLKAADGRPVNSDGAEELLAEGRRAALRGDAEAALRFFERAGNKGSGTAAYLEVVLEAFLGGTWSHHDLRHLMGRPHVVEEIGAEQIANEAAPLFVAGAARERHGGSVPAAATAARMADTCNAVVPGLFPEEAEILRMRDEGSQDPDAWLTAHRTPEPPAFEQALETARSLAAGGAADEAWETIRQALPQWYPTAENRIAPTVLLTDPALREVVTPRRAREVVHTARGGAAAGTATTAETGAGPTG